MEKPELGLFISLIAALALAFTQSGCASTNHQKSASWLFGVYQAEYYNSEEARR